MPYAFQPARARAILRLVPVICLPASLALAGTGDPAFWPSPALHQMFTHVLLWMVPVLISGAAFCLVQRLRTG